MNRRLLFVFCGALVIGAVAAACGGSSDNGAGQTGGAGGTATGGSGGSGTPTGGTGGSATGKAWDAGRIGNTGTDWWINVRRGTYYFGVKLQNSYEDDLAGKAAAQEFANAVLAKIGAGTAAADIGKLVPGSGEVAGWTFDPDNSKTASGPAIATNHDQAEGFIDGSAAPFYTANYSAAGFAWANYVKTDYLLELQIWQMPSAAAATQLYGDLLKNSLYANVSWTDL